MNNRKKVELEVLNITNSHLQAGAFALVLLEKDGTRQLPVIIGATEAQAIILELKGINPPRPLTHALFVSVLEALGAQLLRVLIYKVEGGVYYAYLYLRAGDTIFRVDSRTSDAIVLALRMAAPILIYEDILETGQIRINNPDEGKQGEAEDYTKENHPHPLDKQHEPSLASLKTALEKAIEKENYEQAAVLRDKINQLTQTAR